MQKPLQQYQKIFNTSSAAKLLKCKHNKNSIKNAELAGGGDGGCLPYPFVKTENKFPDFAKIVT